MPITIEEFKQAFAGTVAEDGLARREQRAEGALKSLKQAIDDMARRNGASDGYRPALVELVSRFKSVKGDRARQAVQRSAELDEVVRLADAVRGRLERAGPARTEAGGEGAPLRAGETGTGPAPSADTGPSFPPAEGAQVVLKVLVQGGMRGIAGAVVWAGDVSARADDQGWAALTLRPGTCRYQVSAAGFKDATGEFVVSEEAEQRDSVYLFPITECAEAVVQIRVRDAASRRPIPQALVRFGQDVEETDGDGRAEFIAVKHGDQAYHVSAELYEEQRGSFNVQRSREKVTIDLRPAPVETVAPGADVRFEVLIQSGSEPIARATVWIAEQSETTDGDGWAKFSLQPGTHLYQVSARGFEPVTGKFKVSDRAVQTDSVYLRSLAAAEEAVVVVQVCDAAHGKPIVKALVRLGNDVGYTNGEGAVRFTAIKYGPQIYDVSAEQYELRQDTFQVGRPEETLEVQLTPAPSPGGASEGAGPSRESQARPMKVAVQAAGAESFAASQLTPDLVNVIIKLDNGANKPIKGAEVRLGNNVGRTDGDGVATFRLPAGNYDYRAAAPGYFDDQCNLRIEKRSEQDSWRFSLIRKVQLIVQVKDAVTKNPIAGARLRGRQEQVTDREGYAKFTVRPGGHGWLVSADGFPEVRAHIKVTGEAEHHVEVILLAPERAQGASPKLMEPHG